MDGCTDILILDIYLGIHKLYINTFASAAMRFPFESSARGFTLTGNI